MGWDQLLSIRRDNMRKYEEEYQKREVAPTACPICSAPLDIRSVPAEDDTWYSTTDIGSRNCPLGHWRWNG